MRKLGLLMAAVAVVGLGGSAVAATKTPTILKVTNGRSVATTGIWLAAPADKDLAVQSMEPLAAGGSVVFKISKEHACQQNILVRYADNATGKGTIDVCKVKDLTLH